MTLFSKKIKENKNKKTWVHRNRPPPSSKNPHFQNEARCTTFLVKENEKWFPYQRLSSYPSFETEARENSEMAYCVVKFASPCTLCSPHIRNSGFQNLKGLESRIQVPLTKTGIKYLESGIHGVDSRIQSILDSFTWGDYVHDYVPTQLAIRWSMKACPI